MRRVSEERPDQQAAEPKAGEREPEFESTMDKLKRGALPPEDNLVQLHEAIKELRAIKL